MEQGIGFAQPMDWVQHSAIQLLESVGKYDSARANVSRWAAYIFLNTSMHVTQETMRGVQLSADDVMWLRRFNALLQRLSASGHYPACEKEWLAAAMETKRHRTMSARRFLTAFLRMPFGFEYLFKLPDELPDDHLPVGASDADLTDQGLEAVLAKANVQAALAELTPKQRERLAATIGTMKLGPLTQTAIAHALAIQPGTVGHTVKRGAEAIKDTGALGHLDHESVIYHEKHLRPPAKRRN